MSFWKTILLWTIILIIGFIIFYTNIPVKIIQSGEKNYGQISYNKIIESKYTDCREADRTFAFESVLSSEYKKRMCKYDCDDNNLTYSAYECLGNNKLLCYCKYE